MNSGILQLNPNIVRFSHLNNMRMICKKSTQTLPSLHKERNDKIAFRPSIESVIWIPGCTLMEPSHRRLGLTLRGQRRPVILSTHIPGLYHVKFW